MNTAAMQVSIDVCVDERTGKRTLLLPSGLVSEDETLAELGTSLKTAAGEGGRLLFVSPLRRKTSQDW